MYEACQQDGTERTLQHVAQVVLAFIVSWPPYNPSQGTHTRGDHHASIYVRSKPTYVGVGATRRNPDRSSQLPAYFLPLFLMPWAPVFRGPLPPALEAISLRAFSSVVRNCQHSLLSYFPAVGQLGLRGGEECWSRQYQHASSRGKPCHRRRGPWRPS